MDTKQLEIEYERLEKLITACELLLKFEERRDDVAIYYEAMSKIKEILAGRKLEKFAADYGVPPVV